MIHSATDALSGNPEPPRAAARPIRVLNLIDGLNGGGSERLLWDTVRLTDPAKVRHTISTASPDWFGTFRYASRLAGMGAYRTTRRESKSVPGTGALLAVVNVLRGEVKLPRWIAPLRSAGQIGAMLASFPRALLAVWRYRPDVIHTHTFYSHAHGVLLAKLTGIPVVHTVPCLFAQMRQAGFGWLPWTYRLGRRCIATFLTGASVSDLTEVGISPDKIVPMEGGLDLTEVAEAQTRRPELRLGIRKELGIDSKAIILVNLGRLHSSKGQEIAIRALARLPQRQPSVHFVCVGEGEDRTRLQQLAFDLGLGARVHLVGFKPSPLPYLVAADIFVRTNLIEGDNLSSTQALACGLPFAGFATEQPFDVARDVGAGLLVPTGNDEALAGAITTLLDLPDRGAGLGEVAARAAATRLDFNTTLQLYNGVYAQEQLKAAERRRTSKTSLVWIAKFTATLLVLYAVFGHVVDWADLKEAASRFSAVSLLAVLGLHLLQRLVNARQVQFALGRARISLPIGRVFKIHLITSFFSVALPGELAGAGVSWHLFSKNSGKGAETAGVLVYLRLLGLLALVGYAFGGLFLEPRLLDTGVQWILGAMLLALSAGILAFSRREPADLLSAGLTRLTAKTRLRPLDSILAAIRRGREAFTEMPISAHIELWLLAIVSHGLTIAGGLIAMAAASVAAPASAAVWLVAVVSLLSLVPFTLAGFGIRELGVAALLVNWYGVPSETAVLLSLALGTVSLVASVGLGGLAVLSESLSLKAKPAVDGNLR